MQDQYNIVSKVLYEKIIADTHTLAVKDLAFFLIPKLLENSFNK
jgi:hypothetical protein